ncbi:MAG: hypothetical protein H6718_00195 [Polyangiaceae bacterium]|nr:hypothetical protein [Polyangiaceae bacterium]
MNLLLQWCAHRNVLRDDAKLCSEFTPANFTDAHGFDLTIPLQTITGDDTRECKASLCEARIANCVGYLAKEIETSPTDVEFSWSEFGPTFEGQPIDLTGFGIAQSELDKLPGEPVASSIRFSAPATPGRASLARISSFAHQYATRIGELLATADAGSGQTCAQVFATEDGNGTPTGLAADENNRVPTFTDVFVQSYMDGAIEYQKSVHRAVADMKGSAETQAMKLSPTQGTDLIWNGDIDSARTIANFIGYGAIDPDHPPATGPTPSATDCTPGTASPTQVPVCPPGLTDRTRAITRLMRALKVKPVADDNLSGLLATYQQLQIDQGQTPVGSVNELAVALGVGVADLQSANDYLCAEARVFNKVQIPDGAGGVTGTSTPQGQLASGAISVSFTGAAPNAAASDPTSPQYAMSGAARGLDAVKRTSGVVQAAASQAALDPGLNSAFEGFVEGLKAEAGQHRIKWEIGSPDSSGNHVDNVAVAIYGVPFIPAGPSGFASERYYVVQGIDALKCVVEGNVDGAACNRSDFSLDINSAPIGSFGVTVPADQPDLKGTPGVNPRGTLTASFSTVIRDGSPVAIDKVQPLYLIRETGTAANLTREAFGGVLPAPEGGSVGGGVTRTVWTPAGGSLQDILAQALTPNGDDCSKVHDTCAGLPVDLWPPLESEINGDPNAAQSYESSWKRYLAMAKEAAVEADRRGEELLQQGLTLDLRREQYKDQLLELCGADGEGETGCSESGVDGNSLLADVPWATLGDKQLCAWSLDDVVCGVPAGGMPPGYQCPMPIPDDAGFVLRTEAGEEDYNAQKCKDLLAPADMSGLPSTIEPIPVPYAMKYAASEAPIPEGLCSAFSNLRNGSYTDSAGNPVELHDSAARSNYIRTRIFPNFSRQETAEIMKRITYREKFADHYSLEFDKRPVFETDRPYGRAHINDDSLAPCHVTGADRATGSTFWTQPVNCYVSGANYVMGSGCTQGSGVGKDGCPGESGALSDITYDTEPEALRQRWAFGFGHLRRSVATLGVLTGELNDRMHIAGVWNSRTYTSSGLFRNNGMSCSNQGGTFNDPPWVRRCDWDGADHKGDMLCVAVQGATGVGTDSLRQESGRPVNFNGFIANKIPSGRPDYRTVPASFANTFPWLCPGAGGQCEAGGVDPQMVYCTLPNDAALNSPSSSAATYFSSLTDEQSESGGDTSGFIGAGHTSDRAAAFNTTASGGDWSSTLDEMWTMPEDDFCDPKQAQTLRGAVWRSLCRSFALDGDLTQDDAFMHFGKLADTGATYVQGDRIADWVHKDGSPPSEFLLDQRASRITFQYPLTQRNVYDALELACHAQQYSSSGGVRCEDVSSLSALPPDLDQIAAIMSCHARNLDLAVRNYVVAGVPRALVDALDKEQGISPTSGLGGQYLAELNNMHAAFKQVGRGYSAMRDAHSQLALAVKTLKSIDDEGAALDKALIARTLSTMLSAMADIAGIAAQSAAVEPGAAGNGARAAQAALTYYAAEAAVAAMSFEHEAQGEGLEQKRLSTIANMVSHLGSARAGADEVVLGLNALNQAAANLRLIRKKADTAKSRMEFSDYAGKPGEDPQYVNVVMRRTYNTRLIRYQDALERAKRLAFIARRAIELRFGVDLSRMTSDMTLVDAPAGWANKICDLTGIDYAAIREPDPNGATETWKAGGPPPEGDDFANQYVGDYVTWLEDFVTSYPFDNPLQDGDDVAVVSLRDDIMGSTGQCVAEGRNLLYFSSEFEKRSGTTNESDAIGWRVEECGLGAPTGPEEVVSEDWEGCVSRVPAGLPPDQLVGLPPAAVAYRLANRACDSGYELCPDVAPGYVYTATGAVTQYFSPRFGTHHVASVYVKQDAAAAAYSGYTALLEVEHQLEDGSFELVASHAFTPSATWAREETAAFPAYEGDIYRVRLYPAHNGVAYPGHSELTLTNPAPALFVAAASVESVGQELDGTPGSVGLWQRTDASRNGLDPRCAEAAPQGMRKNFRYKCDYICRDGIGKDCPADGGDAVPVNCFYEANFYVDLEQIEAGKLIPSGQLAIGNFNFRHNQVGINLVGTNVKTCEGVSNASCFGNGFVEYTLLHSGATKIRNYTGDALPAKMDNAYIEHGKGLATERLITNPPSSADEQQLSNYMKKEFKGRPLQGLYTIRVWDTPGLRWENLEDVQLVWKYHYWSRFQK